MIKELARLVIGLVVLGFHRQIATWVLKHEQQLAQTLASRGWLLPSFPSEKSAHDVYFCIGVFMCFFSLARLWFVL